MASTLRSRLRALLPLAFAFAGALAPSGCTCSEAPPPAPVALAACAQRGQVCPAAPPLDPASKTTTPGTIPSRFSLSAMGDAGYVMRLEVVPGRDHVEPDLSLVYRSSTGDGVLGVGFSLAGASSITRCPSNLLDGDIRDVRFDSKDHLCIDGVRLVPVSEAPGIVEYRTLPDTFVKVIGHFPSDAKEKTPDNAISFESHLPSGFVVEYGTGKSGKPLALRGVPRAFLATKARDARGNAMTYSYCFADKGGYTAEYALTEIRYTSFEGSPSVEPSRAVRFVHGTKDPADIRIQYAHGMAFQDSMRLNEIQMLGPEQALVRRYVLAYDQSATTNQTRLISVEECGADGACKPPTRFQYKSDKPGFKRITTNILAPTSKLASPMLFDIDGDARDDLIVPDTDPLTSTPQNPITHWALAKNRGPGASPPYFDKTTLAFSEEWPLVADPSGPADPALIQPELGTSIDYDQDGKTDIILHDVYGTAINETILVAQSDHTFKKLDSGIRRPFPLAAPPPPPNLTTPGGSVHLADLNGDGVPDRIQCEDHAVDGIGTPGEPLWTVQLWHPAQGATPAGFEEKGSPIDTLEGFACNTSIHIADVNGDGKTDIVVPSILKLGGTEEIPKLTYSAISRRNDGSFEVFDLKLPIVHVGGRVLFVDVTGDGLPDAIESSSTDHLLHTYINTGSAFAKAVESLESDSIGEQDTFFSMAVALDYNGDNRRDLLMALPGGVTPNIDSTLPRWFVLEATGSPTGATFTAVDAGIPFEPLLGDTITLADPRAPRVGDLNGDGASDVVVLLGGAFNIFENLAADQDVLVGVSDGMNDHEPEEPGFVPTVAISYGHLNDEWITNGSQPGDPKSESYLYRSHADAANDCDYPRHCVVGSRRVVSGYLLNDGQGGQRRYGVRYFDGRYDRLGHGFLGFAKRIVTDLDTGAGTADFYDNRTSFVIEGATVFPFAGQVVREWQWYPALPNQPAKDPIELLFFDGTPTFVPTNDDKTYFALPTKRRIRRVQGVYPPPGDPSKSIEAYAAEVEAKGGATVLRDTTTTVSGFDTFGNVLAVDVQTIGVDLTLHFERTMKNDTERWILGQLQTQKECSSAAMQSQCRTLTRTTTDFGEVHTENVESDDKSPETQLGVAYIRDAFGNVTDIVADDAYGHHRAPHTDFDAEGIFPTSHTNAAGHKTAVEFDSSLGVLKKQTDPNQLVTTFSYDSLGRLEHEERPDGLQTTITRSRAKSGNAWRMTEETTTSGGEDELTEYDALGRPTRVLSHGTDTIEQPGAPPRIMQIIAYDRLSGNVARRSVPIGEDTPEAQLRFDVYQYDAMGREVQHTAPWKATTATVYNGLSVQITDPRLFVTIYDLDALGRPVTITDAAKGTTKYTYGPFDTLYTVEDPGGAITRTTRDALGRIRKLEDPDRGAVIQVHDGFGELTSTTDALGRVVTLELDALGRTKSRTDKKGAEVVTTTWTWDTAPNGIGRLHKLAGPDAEKTYSYNARGQLASLTLSIKGQNEDLKAGYTYDPFGRLATLAYPSPKGIAPLVAAYDYDAYGHLLKVRDSATDLPYWRLTAVDTAGRIQTEMFGNGAVTDRSYYPDKQAIKSIATNVKTQLGALDVQDLSYGYDDLLNLTSRTDARPEQQQHPTERFRYDALERVTCAYFSVKEDPLAPCAQSYGYAPNGNLTYKSDVGVLTYDDPAHPHAVKNAAGDIFGYNAVGNQTTRPGGVTITYTPFDLPASITQGASATTFGYDGDQARIRKTTPTEETVYLGALYERVTKAASTEHRFYIHSSERAVAVVTRGGQDPGTRYIHVDHLGSVDALTNENGTIDERRSYDAFGQRRNPLWGQPPPASFNSKTTRGYTGHEADHELGLVNMKGRVFDPRLGRFLTTDPIIADPHSGQAFNRYSYVFNNPLTLIDPSGFEPDDPPPLPDPDVVDARQGLTVFVRGEPRKPHEPKDEGTSPNAEVGASKPASDVGVTGDSPSDASEAPPGISLDDVRRNPYTQIEGGFISGLLLGLVPFGGMGQQFFDTARVLPSSTTNARIGFSIGLFVGGIVTLLEGVGGDVAGGAATVTGVGAPVGVPAIVVSTGVAVAGIANMAAGVNGLLNALSQGSGGSGPKPTAATEKESSPRRFGKADRDAGFEKSKDASGTPTCDYCDQKLDRNSGKPNSYEPDHRQAHSKGGPSDQSNLTPSCRTCNRSKGSKDLGPEWTPPKDRK